MTNVDKKRERFQHKVRFLHRYKKLIQHDVNKPKLDFLSRGYIS
jgi:hypothetical protein